MEIKHIIKQACLNIGENHESVAEMVDQGYKGAYHNLYHVYTVISLIEYVTPEVYNSETIVASALHDALPNVDDVVSKYRAISTSPSKTNIVSLIRATKHPVKRVLKTKAEQAIHDADLAVLGFPPSMFNKYERKVREEYRFVDSKVYYTERGKILKSLFLNQELGIRSLYQTQEFRDVFHRQSILNIDKALKLYVLKTKQNNSM